MSLLATLTQFILNIVEQVGPLGIFIGMTIESSFIPFPSEIILIPAGALVAQGKMSFLFVFASAVLGSLLGAYVNYLIGEHFGRRVVNKLVRKYGKFVLITEEKLAKADTYFNKHGKITIFTSRLIPGIRQIISIPAGFSKMDKKTFFIYTALGSGLWSLILIVTGYALGNNPEILKQNQFLLLTLLAVTLIIILYFYLRHKKKPSLNPKQSAQSHQKQKD